MAAAFHNCSTLIKSYEENDREQIYQIIEQAVDKDLLVMGAKYLVLKEQLADMVDESKETLMRLKDAMDYIGLDKPLMTPLLDLLEGEFTVNWFYKNDVHPKKLVDYEFKWSCRDAAKFGALNVLKWLRENRCWWDERTCENAAKNGHLEVLKWARANGYPWDEWTCIYAALGGHLEILKWARENGCPWTTRTCQYAALNGHLELLKWLRENGCPWDKETYLSAAEYRHYDVMNWALENGCPLH